MYAVSSSDGGGNYFPNRGQRWRFASFSNEPDAKDFVLRKENEMMRPRRREPPSGPTVAKFWNFRDIIFDGPPK